MCSPCTIASHRYRRSEIRDEGRSRRSTYCYSCQRDDKAVRRYLETEFQLNPKLIGVMLLAESPPASSGKRVWDGVSVVMIH